MRTLITVQLVVTVVFGWGSLATWAVAHAPSARAPSANAAPAPEAPARLLADAR